jgi:hypothetical protein
LGRGEGVKGMEEVRRWCADFVEKASVVEGVQRTESSWGRMIIFKISETVRCLKRKNRRVEFQVEVEGWIRSEIAKGYEEIK